VREGVDVELLAQDDELYVSAQSAERAAKERAIRRQQLKWLWARLGKLAAMTRSYEAKLMKLGAARSGEATTWFLVDVKLDKRSAAPSYSLNHEERRIAASGRALSLARQFDQPDPAVLR